MKYFNDKSSFKKMLSSLVMVFMMIFSCVPAFSEAVGSVEVQENIDILVKTNTCAGCNLAGADLNRINLSGADLRNADLTGATFFLADLSNANLSGAILRGTQFGGADLAQADLRGADLRGALITGAYTVGSLMDGKVVDREILDKDTEVSLYEKVFIPDDDKTKELPDKQDVKISKRRDFDPVPPVIEETKLQKGDTAQGPSALASEQDAPPAKSVAPVGHITITEQQELPAPQEMVIENEVSKKKDPVTVPDLEKQSQDLVASKNVVHAEPEYRQLSDAKKTNAQVKTNPAIDLEKIKKVPEGSGVKTVSGNDSAAVVSAQNDEKPAEQSVNSTVSISSAKEAEIEENDPADAVKEKAPSSAQKPAEIATNKQVHKQEQKQSDLVEKTPQGTDKIVPETGLSADTSDSLQVSAKDADEKVMTPASRPLVDGSPGTIAVPAAGQGMGDSGAVINDVNETTGNYNRLLATEKCPGCNLAGVDLSGKRLGEADLERANLSGSILEGVDLSKANLKGVNFRNANLKNSDLRKADLYKADFSGADLTGADFEGALTDETNFAGAVGYPIETRTK